MLLLRGNLANETAKVLATGQFNMGNSTNHVSVIGTFNNFKFLRSDYEKQ